MNENCTSEEKEVEWSQLITLIDFLFKMQEELIEKDKHNPFLPHILPTIFDCLQNIIEEVKINYESEWDTATLNRKYDEYHQYAMRLIAILD